MRQASENLRHWKSQLDDQATSLVKIQLVRQILWLRWSVSITTVIILALFALLEFRIWKAVSSADGNLDLLPSTFFVWAVSPVAAIAGITVFAWIGVFRGFRGNEMDGVENVVGKIARQGNDPTGQA